MRTLGILGGMSWESTLSYYKGINVGVRDRLGGLSSAPLIIHSFEFSQIAKLQKSGEWEKAGELLANAALNLQNAGAEGIVLATNTMHKVCGQIVDKISIPFIHIADATANSLKEIGVKKVGLLGTAFTMEQEFYISAITNKHGFTVVVPDQPSRVEVNRIIFDELCQGVICDSSKASYLEVISSLAAKGAEAVILGCTEIGLLISQNDVSIPIVDSTAAHIKAAVEFVVG